MTKPAPTPYKLTVEVIKGPNGQATDVLLGTGSTKPYCIMQGGWDDVTPWGNQPFYNAPSNGPYDYLSSWKLDGIANRSGVLLHSDSGVPGSKTSTGCLVVDPEFIASINAHLGFQGTNTLNIIPSGSTAPATISLTPITSTVKSDQYVKLNVNLAHAVSKDVWVFITVKNPNDPKNNEFKTNLQTSKDVLVKNSSGKFSSDVKDVSNFIKIVNAGPNPGSGYNLNEKTQNGFWVRVPAGQTTVEIDVKPNFNPYNAQTPNDATEQFTVSDYAILYVARSQYYKDGESGNTDGSSTSKSDVLTEGKATEKPVSITVTKNSHECGVNCLGFETGANDLNQTWQFGLDPTPTSNQTYTIDLNNDAILTSGGLKLTYIDLQGKQKNVALASKGTSGKYGKSFTEYTFNSSQISNSEGQLTLSGLTANCIIGTVYINGYGISDTGDDAMSLASLTPDISFSLGATSDDAVNLASDAALPTQGSGPPNTFTSSGGVTTSTNSAGQITCQETVNPDGSGEITLYDIIGEPFTAEDTLYNTAGNVTSVTLYGTDNAVYLSGTATGTLNADGTSTVALTDANGAVEGQMVLQNLNNGYYGTTLTLYTPGGITPASTAKLDSYGNLLSAQFFDASGNLVKNEVTTWQAGQTFYTYRTPTGILVEQVFTGIGGAPYYGTDTTYDPSGAILSQNRLNADFSVYQYGVNTANPDGSSTLAFTTPAGVLVEADTTNADKSRQISLFNIANEPYASSVTNNDASGYLISQRLYYASGATYQTTTVNSDNSTTILTYDPAGLLLAQEVDNGTFPTNVVREVIQYGITGQAYNAIETGYTKYTANAPIGMVVYFNNDGSQTVDTFNPADEALTQIETIVANPNGSTTDSFFTPANLLKEVDVIAANGSQDDTVYSTPGQTLPSTVSLYDADDDLLQQTVNNADGTKAVTIFDIDDQIYVTETTNYNVAGQQVSQSFVNNVDDLVETDATAYNSDGSATTTYLDANNNIMEIRTVAPDGSQDVKNYNDAGVPFLASDTQYNSAGQEISETDYSQIGKVTQVTDVSQNSDGSTTVKVYGALGALQSAYIVAVDGSSELKTYGGATAAWALTDQTYDADDQLTSETDYNANGSIGQTITVTDNADGSITTDTYTGTGVLAESDVVAADGSSIDISYNPTSSISKTITATNADDELISTTYFNSDGTRDVVTVAADDLYRAIDSHYSSTGTLLTKSLINADDEIIGTGAPVSNPDGSTTTTYVNPDDHIVALTETDYVGGAISFQTPATAASPYASVTVNYSVDDTLTSKTYLTASGAVYQTETFATDADDDFIDNLYSASGALIQSTATSPNDLVTVSNYDASGALTRISISYDDTPSSVTTYGITGQNYVTLVQNYNASGVLTSETQTHADGSYNLFAYGITGEPWTEIDSAYNAAGVLVEKTLITADDDVYLSGAASQGSNGYAINYYKATGALAIAETDYTWGGGSFTTYGITGEPYTHTTTYFWYDNTITSIDYYSASNALLEYDNNTTGTIFRYFPYGSPYTETESTYSADDVLETTTFFNKDYSRSVETYGITGEPYASVLTNYDTYANISSIERLNADGSIFETGTPVNYKLGSSDAAPDGSTTFNFLTPDGTLAETDVTFANGDTIITDLLVANEPYATTASYFNADDQLTKQTFTNADGSSGGSFVNTYDGFTLTASANYNSSGIITNLTLFSGGTTTTETFNAAGVLDEAIALTSDGYKTVSQYGIIGQPYNTIETDDDPTGAVTQVTYLNNDGTYTIVVPTPADDNLAFASADYLYNSSDQLISIRLLTSSGEACETYNYAYGADGSTTATTYNSEGVETAIQVTNGDGSSLDHEWDLDDLPYASSVTAASASGSSSATFYNADGSLYGTETIAIDSADDIFITDYDPSGAITSESEITAAGNWISLSPTNGATVSVDDFLANQASLDAAGDIAISDTAANVAANFDALDADVNIDSITLSDNATLTLSVAQALNDTQALGEIANATFTVGVADSAANIAANLDALNGETRLAFLTITGGGAPSLTLTVAQALNDTAALAAITNPSCAILISDTAANVVENLDALSVEAGFASITLTDSPTPTLSLSVAQATDDATALSAIASPYAIAIVDSAANVATGLASLNNTPDITSITLTDSATPTLILTAAQALGDAATLAKITGAYSIAISDTAANITANLAGLSANTHITSITLTDSRTSTISLTVAQALADASALAKVANPNYDVTVFDTAANLAANLADLSAIANIGSITLTDSGTPILTLSAAQSLNDTGVLGKISNPNYAIKVIDSSANVLADIGALNANPRVTSITLTGGTPTLTLTIGEALGEAASTFAKITGAFSIVVADTPADIAAVTASAAAALKANGYARILASAPMTLSMSAALALSSNGIAVTGAPVKVAAPASAILVLTATQAAALISGGYPLALSDSAANIQTLTTSQIAKLAIFKVTSIAASGNLALSKGQMIQFANYQLPLSAPAGDVISVTDTACNIHSISTTQMAAFAALGVDTLISATGALTLTAAQIQAVEAAGLTVSAPGASVSVTDTAANLTTLTPVQIANLASVGVTSIACLNANLFISVSQATTIADAGLTITMPAGGRLAINDASAAIGALTPIHIAALAALGVSSLYANDLGITLNAAQATALEAARLCVQPPANCKNTLSDFASVITGLNPSQLSGLTTLHIATLSLLDGAATFTVAQAITLEAANIKVSTANGAPNALLDAAPAIKALTSQQIAGLANLGINGITADATALVVSAAMATAFAKAGITLSAANGQGVSVSDVAANISALSAAQIVAIAAAGVSQFSVSAGKLTLSASQAAALIAAHAKIYNSTGSIALSDAAGAIDGLTPAQIAALPAAGITTVTATNGVLTLTLSQAAAFAAAGITPSAPAGSTISISDTASGLALASPNQILALKALGVTTLIIKGASGVLTAAQALALETAGLTIRPVSLTLTLTDSGLAINALTPGQIAGLTKLDVAYIQISDAPATLTASQAQAFESAHIAINASANPSAPNAIVDTASGIEALTTAQITNLGLLNIGETTASDTNLFLSVAQGLAFSAANDHLAAPAGSTVEIADHTAALSALTTAQITALASDGVGELYANNANISYTVAQTAAIVADGLTVAAATGHIATENFANGDYSSFGANGLVGRKTINADATYEIDQFQVANQSYISSQTFYGAGGQQLATATDNADGSGTLTLLSSGDFVLMQAGALSTTIGNDVFLPNIHATETIAASKSGGDTFEFLPAGNPSQAVWQDILSGFVATGASHEIIELQASAFGAGLTAANQDADLHAMLGLMTQNSLGQAVIHDRYGDALTLAGVNKTTLSAAANATDFKFV